MIICDIGPTWCALWSLGCFMLGGLFGVFGLALVIMGKSRSDE